MALTDSQLLALAKLRAGKQSSQEMVAVPVVMVAPANTLADAMSATKALAASIVTKATAATVVTPTANTASIATNVLASHIPEAPTKQPNGMGNYVLHESIAKLAELILTAHPTLPVLLKTIHKQIAADPELAIILSEEEIGIIVNGCKLQTKTEITTSVIKSASKASTKKKPLTLDMF